VIFQHLFLKGPIIRDHGKNAFRFQQGLTVLFGGKRAGKRAVASARQISMKQKRTVQHVRSGQDALVDLQQKGVLFKSAQMPDMQRAQLSHGLYAQENRCIGKSPDAFDGAGINPKYPVNEQKALQSRANRHVHLRINSAAFWPPNPKFSIIIVRGESRIGFRTKLTRAWQGDFRFRTGGSQPSCMQKRQTAVSMAPQAAERCPNQDFRAITFGLAP